MTGSFINPLSRRPKAGYPDASARLKAETRALLGLAADVVISVELACREPGCPDIETIVTVPQADARSNYGSPRRRIRTAGVGDFAIPVSAIRLCAAHILLAGIPRRRVWLRAPARAATPSGTIAAWILAPRFCNLVRGRSLDEN